MCVESFFGSETKKVGDDFKNYLKGKYIAWLTKNNNSIVNYVNKMENVQYVNLNIF